MAVKKIETNAREVGAELKHEGTAFNIHRVPLSSLNLWKDNPRKNDKNLDKLAEILKEHGQRSPLVVWSKNMVIYKGNTTFKAAKKLGWTHIEVIMADFHSEAAAIAYGIADNKASEWSTWDNETLTRLMSANEISERPTATGFTHKEAEILKKFYESEVTQADAIGKVANVDLQGGFASQGDFIAVTFPDADSCARFKTAFGMGRTERALGIDRLTPAMLEDWAEACR